MFNETAVITQFVQDRVQEIVAHARVKYNAPEFDVNIKISFATGIRTSRGGIKNGQAFIKLSCLRYIEPCRKPNSLIDEFEYKHYRSDPVIGEMKSVSWTTALACLVAHEMAHAIQFFPSTKEGAKAQLGLKGLDARNGIFAKHDYFFQRIYADLRSIFVNGRKFSTPVATESASTAKPSLTGKKDWYSREHNARGGRYAYYYNKDDVLIGCLFNRWKQQIYIYNPKTNEYTPTGLYDIREARRKIFSL